MSIVAEREQTMIGWCVPEVRQELPQLQLAFASVTLAPSVSPDCSAPLGVRERLAALSDRFNGSRAIALRGEPVPAAYRAFFRQIGLDPEVARTPVEAAVLDRLIDGAFLPSGLLSDVLLVALIDTGVPVWALERRSLQGRLGIRISGDEQLGRGGDGAEVQGGRLVVADAASALALLFEPPAAAHRPTSRSRQLTLYALQVEGVPWLAVEEALWICRSALEAVG